MTGSEYQVWLKDFNGSIVADLTNFVSASTVQVVNAVGYVQVIMPGTFDESLLHVDYLLEIWRRPEGGSMTRLNSGFLRRWTTEMDADGMETITLFGPDLNYLLTSRIVAYFSGQNEGRTNSEPADDEMRHVVRENLGGLATDTDRQITTYLQTAANESQGPVIDMIYAHDEVDKVLQDMAEISDALDDPVYFAIEQDGDYHFRFRTAAGQLGSDLTAASLVQFGTEFGNISEPVLVKDYVNEVTIAYALGRGYGSAMRRTTAQDLDRSGRSPFGRREAMVNAKGQEEIADGLLNAARKRVAEGRPRLRFKARILDTPQARFQIDWGFGDRIPVQFRDFSGGALVKAYKMQVKADGSEQFEAWAEVDDAI